jgi:hypothetical protein
LLKNLVSREGIEHVGDAEGRSDLPEFFAGKTSLPEMPSRERAARPGFQVLLEPRRSLLTGELDCNENSPRPAIRGVRRLASVVGVEPRFDVSCKTRIKAIRSSFALE